MMNAEEGGLEDLLTGTTIVDKGYTSGNIGAPIGNAPITMAIATPKGTKMMAPGRSQDDPQVILDRGQKLHVSKVEPDGQGGFNVMAILTDEGGPEEHIVSPTGEVPETAAREQSVQDVANVRAQRMKATTDRETELQELARPVEARVEQQELERQQQERIARMPPDRPAPQPAGGGPAPRQEQLQSEMLGGRPAAPPPPEGGEEQEDVRIRDFREAFRAANIEVPSSGSRRREFNKAYSDIVNGKRDPEDVLRELEADIRDNNARMDEATTRETPRLEAANLEADIDRQEKLADLIAEQRGLERRSQHPRPAVVAPTSAACLSLRRTTCCGGWTSSSPRVAGTRTMTSRSGFKVSWIRSPLSGKVAQSRLLLSRQPQSRRQRGSVPRQRSRHSLTPTSSRG
jgi:hypothetical protein